MCCFVPQKGMDLKMDNPIKKQGSQVWIYCRVNSPDDMALKFQQEQMVEYARKQGWEVVGITAEQGSGLDSNRKGLTEVMEAIEAEQINIVLAKSVCRIGRDVYKTMECVEWMNRYGVKLISADNGEVNFKPANDIGFMMTV
ncbi:recombinase family protein [Desulfosporosinus burensis]